MAPVSAIYATNGFVSLPTGLLMLAQQHVWGPVLEPWTSRKPVAGAHD